MRFQDKRSGKVVVVANCILNQNSRVLGLAHYPAIIDGVIDVLKRHKVGFLQMPCPELTYLGIQRPSKTREEYNTPSYKKHCKYIAFSIANQIEEFTKNGVEILAVLGIKNSPSCGIGDITGETGILIEELKSELEKKGLNFPLRAIKTSDITTDVEWLEEILRTD